MERMLGVWMYWQRWERLREVAPTMSNREDRLEQALRDYYRFNVHARTNKMTINQIAHCWHVFGTELREEIEFARLEVTDLIGFCAYYRFNA